MWSSETENECGLFILIDRFICGRRKHAALTLRAPWSVPRAEASSHSRNPGRAVDWLCFGKLKGADMNKSKSPELCHLLSSQWLALYMFGRIYQSVQCYTLHTPRYLLSRTALPHTPILARFSIYSHSTQPAPRLSTTSTVASPSRPRRPPFAPPLTSPSIATPPS